MEELGPRDRELFARQRREWEEMASVDPYHAVDNRSPKQPRDDFFASGQEWLCACMARLAERGWFPPEDGRALDFGCGVGRIAKALAGRFAHVDGVDVARPMIAEAVTQHWNATGVEFRLQPRLEPLAFADREFDFVVCLLVLQHQPHEGLVRWWLHELIRLLKPGGRLVFQLPYATSGKQRLQIRCRGYRWLRTLRVPPTLLMWCTLKPISMLSVPQERVEEMVAEGGGTILHIHRDDECAGPRHPSSTYYVGVRTDVPNLDFDLTREINAEGAIAALSSGQADWILQETEEACKRVLDVLGRYGARYRPGAPLDIRWLANGWSSHFEFLDPRGRRIRCDFLSRPPRVPLAELPNLFASFTDRTRVVPIETLIRMQQSHQAKDYPVIGGLAQMLPPEREIELTTDPDRVIALARRYGQVSKRGAVQAACTRRSRDEVVIELAREADRMQTEDRERLKQFRAVSEGYLLAFEAAGIARMHLPEAHQQAVKLAETMLPPAPLATGPVPTAPPVPPPAAAPPGPGRAA